MFRYAFSFKIVFNDFKDVLFIFIKEYKDTKPLEILITLKLLRYHADILKWSSILYGSITKNYYTNDNI